MKKLSEIYKELGIEFKFPIKIKNFNGNLTYYEDCDGLWHKKEYDSNGNQTYYENSYGYWCKSEYNSDGNKTYREDSDNYWRKSEYNSNGKVTYFENSHGYWCKSEYDSDGIKTYYEDSDGNKKGKPRSQSCEGKVIEVDGIKYELKAVKDYEYKAPKWVNWPV